MKDPALWQRLAGFNFPLSRPSWRLADLVARELRVTKRNAALIVDEYRRFLYLAATAEEPVAASPVIDKVWRLHLRDHVAYTGALSREVVRREIIRREPRPPPLRDPAYVRTLALYRQEFTQAPFDRAWPGPGLLRRQRRAWAVVIASFALAALSIVLSSLHERAAVLLFLAGWVMGASSILWLHFAGPWPTLPNEGGG